MKLRSVSGAALMQQRSFLHHLFQVASTKPCQWRQAPQTSASFRPIHIYGRHIGSAKSRDSATRRSTSIISARRFPPEQSAYRVSNLGKLVGVSSDVSHSSMLTDTIRSEGRRGGKEGVS